MKAGFLGVPFCLAIGVGKFEVFEVASEVHAKTMLLAGVPALWSSCLKEVLRTGGNVSLGDFDLSGGFVQRNGIPVKH